MASGLRDLGLNGRLVAKLKIDKKAIERVAREAAEKRRRELQAVLDDVREQMAGADVADVESVLKRKWRSVTGEGPIRSISRIGRARSRLGIGWRSFWATDPWAVAPARRGTRRAGASARCRASART